MRTPFDVLGIDRDADETAIDRAYRQRVLETHPDQGGSREEFQLVRAAYEAIKTGDWTSPEETPAGQKASDGDVESWRMGVNRERHPGAHVAFLDHDVLDDYGWSLSDDDLFEKAEAADLEPPDFGQMRVQPHESLLEAAENSGYTWPYACRGGACANCAVAMVEGDLAMPANHVLPEEMMADSIRLSCNGLPTDRELKVVYNLKHRPDLDDLRLPPHRFERDQASD